MSLSGNQKSSWTRLVAMFILKVLVGSEGRRKHMKKIIVRYGLMLFALFVIGLIMPRQAHAVEFLQQKEYVLSTNQLLTEELWLLSDTAILEGDAQDALFVIAETISFSGVADDDLWCLGETIDFTGTVESHARIAAVRSLRISGKIGRNLMAGANTISLEKEASVNGSALLAGENVILAGFIGGKATVFATHATIGGKINGPLRIYAEDIVVLPGTEINGDLTYTSRKELVLDNKVALRGQLVRDVVATQETKEPAASWSSRLFYQIYFFIAALIVGLIWLACFAPFTNDVVLRLRASGWRCALAGIVTLCFLPMFSGLLLLTIIGIPLSILLILTLTILLYVAKFTVAQQLGFFILRRTPELSYARSWPALAIGLLALYGLFALPFVGNYLWWGVTTIGLGGIVMGIFRFGKQN